MRAWAVALAIWLGLAFAAGAADLPLYQPTPGWVKPIAIPKPDAAHEDGAAQVLLQNVQSRFTGDEDQFYSETAVKIRSAKGLSESGNIILVWRPDTETLVVHKLSIIRGDQVIDLLAGGKTMQVLHRETNLEMAMLDGALTATLQPEGLQVGDILNLAYTREVRDPVMKGRSQDWAQLARPGVIRRAYVRAIWPKSKSLRWRATDGLGKESAKDTADGRELVFDLTDVEAPRPPQGAPSRFSYLAQLQLTDFASWAEVSTLSEPLYSRAATLAANSPLRAEIDKIKAASPDPKARAIAALQLVQDKVRYLYLGLNNGGYIPADADVTWTRRFGDCKAKTVLLLALLKGLGIDAQPALVSTVAGDGLDERLPSMDAFDHVAVRARIDGKTYWMDGTRIGDTDLEALPMPGYHWMLPVQASGGALEKMLPTVYADPRIETRMRLDASAGLDAPAPAHLEYIYRGDAGLAIQQAMQAMSRSDMERAMKTFWQSAMPWIEPKQVQFTPDTGHGAVMTMDGLATMTWSASDGSRDFPIRESNLGSEINIQREPGPNHDAPFAVAYPFYAKGLTTVVLPDHGKGFVLANSATINQTLAGSEFKKSARIENGVATVEISVRAVAPEFSYAEAAADAATLREWSEHPVVIRASPALAQSMSDAAECMKGSVAGLKICASLLEKYPSGSPQSAAAFYGMGRADLAKADWDQAFDHFDKTIKAQPQMALAYEGRAEADAGKHDYAHAIQDYDEAIKRDPSVAVEWGNRGNAYADMGQPDRAIADYNQAIELNPADAVDMVNRGLAYRSKKDWTRATADFDLAIKTKPDYADAYGDRAAVAFDQRDYVGAVKDYSEAVRLSPVGPVYWLDRGLAYSAQGNWTAALQDFEEAIRRDPNDPKSLTGRASAHEHLGQPGLAVEDYNRMIAEKPGNETPLLARARLYRDRKDWEHSLTDYDQLIKMKPTPEYYSGRAYVYQLKGDLERAIQDFSESIRLRPDYRLAIIDRGLAYVAKGDQDRGILDYDRALQLDPSDATTHWRRARAYDAKREWDKAIADYDQAIHLQPDYADAFNGRGYAYQVKGNLDQAMLDYNEAIRIKPDYRQAVLNRAILWARKSNQTAAIADYDRAIQLNPKEPYALRDRGLAYAALKNWDHAIQDYDLALQLKPDFSEAFGNRGIAHQARREFDLAIADFDAELRLRPDDTSILLTRGRAKLVKGDGAGAMADFNRLVALRPADANVLVNRAAAADGLGDLEQAIKDASEAIRLNPSFAGGWGIRGEARVARGELEAGFHDLDDYVRLAPPTGIALNTRCWARAKLGQGLDLALADCDFAVGTQPTNASFRDSRGLVHFRRGEYEAAISDLNRALEFNPKLAASLYVRGLAEQRLNRKAEADADIAAAKVITPGIADTYAKMGVSPQPAALAAAQP